MRHRSCLERLAPPIRRLALPHLLAALVVALLLATGVRAPAAHAATTTVLLTQTCSSTPGRVAVSFTWNGSDPAAQQKWLDLSVFNNGWLPGTFLGNGPLLPSSTALVWDGLISTTDHYVRLNQQLSNGAWDPSRTFSFTTIDCGGAFVAALTQLGALSVKPPAAMTGYSRDQFGPAWQDVDDNGCDTRNDILQRDLAQFVLRIGSACIVETGTLHDPYTAETILFVRGVGTSSDVQIDHVVALAAAWRTGAALWTFDTRLHYANDPEVLLAVDGPANSQKSDGDAADWLPANPAFRCAYAVTQVLIKVKYELWVTPPEHDALDGVLTGCATDGSPPAPVATPSPTAAPDLDGHTWYTSAATNARVFYCELDEGWKGISAANLRSFAVVEELLAAFPNRGKSTTSKC